MPRANATRRADAQRYPSHRWDDVSTLRRAVRANETSAATNPETMGVGPGVVVAHRAALVRRRRARILVAMTAAEDLRRLFETQRGCARVPGASSFPR